MRATFLVLLCWAASLLVPTVAAKPYHATRERRVSFDDQPQQVRSGLREIRAELYRLVLPDIHIRSGSLNDAIEAIRQGFRERDPEHLGLGILLRLPSEPAPPPVSLKLHSASVAEAFDALCAQGDYVWYVDLYSVTILPAKEFVPILRRRNP